MLFSELCKIMANKDIFVGFKGGDRPNPPPLDPPPDWMIKTETKKQNKTKRTIMYSSMEKNYFLCVCS